LLAVEQGERLFKLRARRDLGRAEVGRGEAAARKMLHRQADAANPERLGTLGVQTLPEDHFGRAPADVDHQTRQVAGLQARDALVDQPGFFASGNDLDGMPQDMVAALQKGITVAGLPQGLGGHRTHLPGREALEANGKSGQAGQPALGGFFGQHAVAVEAGPQAHGFLEVVDPLVAALAQLADLEPETVGPHVDGRQQNGAWARRGRCGGGVFEGLGRTCLVHAWYCPCFV
jgi:hypothetical protein